MKKVTEAEAEANLFGLYAADSVKKIDESFAGPTEPSGLVAPPRAGEYQTISMDSPWPERGGGKIRRGANRHYQTMTVRQICELPIGQWAAPNAHLYSWVTNNYLEAGLEAIRRYGFRYVTKVSWFKDRIGLGQYYRGRTEDCLFAVRGNLPYRIKPDGKRAQGETGFEAPDPDECDHKFIDSAFCLKCGWRPEPALQDFKAVRTEHSRKPEEMRRMIEIVSPGPYLEVFARRAAPGWDIWGNEAPNDAEGENR